MVILDKIIPTKMMMRFINNMGTNPDVIRTIIITQYEQTCKKYVRKAQKKGKKVKVSDLTKLITDNRDFEQLCKRLGLDRQFFEGIAKSVIKKEEKHYELEMEKASTH